MAAYKGGSCFQGCPGPEVIQSIIGTNLGLKNFTLVYTNDDDIGKGEGTVLP